MCCGRAPAVGAARAWSEPRLLARADLGGWAFVEMAASSTWAGTGVHPALLILVQMQWMISVRTERGVLGGDGEVCPCARACVVPLHDSARARELVRSGEGIRIRASPPLPFSMLGPRQPLPSPTSSSPAAS